MRSTALLQFALAASVLCSLGQFLDPDRDGAEWRIGETKKIAFNTTLRHYTIGLWQRAPPTAVLGEIVLRVLNAQGGIREFTWEVQAYGLDLSVSNVAYLWLFEGEDPNQGNQTLRHISSATFTIIGGDPASGPGPPGSSTSRRAPTKAVVLSSTGSSVPPSSAPAATPTNALPLPPGLSDAASSTGPPATSTAPPAAGTSGGPGVTQTTSGGGSTSAGDGQATQTGEAGGSGAPGGLPVGAQAGIGVGVGIFGITCVVCAVMLYRYLKRNQKALAEVQQTAMVQPPAYFHGSVVSPMSEPRSPTKSAREAAGYYVNPKPIEIA